MISSIHEEVIITDGNDSLTGELHISKYTKSVIIFSHGSGSSRYSKRNQQVAKYLQKNGHGTLLFDLLTEEEDINYQNRFDIDLLSKRLIVATQWLENKKETKDYSIGYFGASTGAAAALTAAAYLPQIKAVVSRGGRPDLAKEILSKVKAPTLLIVGSLDTEVVQLNIKAYNQMNCEKKIEIVEGATHLFEEMGKMEIVSVMADNWFRNYLATAKL